MPTDHSSSLARLLAALDQRIREYDELLRLKTTENRANMQPVRDRADLDQVQAALRELRRRLIPDSRCVPSPGSAAERRVSTEPCHHV